MDRKRSLEKAAKTDSKKYCDEKEADAEEHELLKSRKRSLDVEKKEGKKAKTDASNKVANVGEIL